MPQKIKLDEWQKDFLKTKGDKILCTGRQVGKSVICSIDAGEYAINNYNKIILMIAPTERQAFALFDKTLNYLADNYKTTIMKGKNRPTLSRIKLKNKTIIYCLPTGLAGLGIRFLTVDRLYADEASRIPENVWAAVTPMLLTTGGDTILLSTPAGPEGYFADVVENRESAFNSFTRFTKGSEEVIRAREISESWTEQQRDKALDYLEREKLRWSKRIYAQEYLGRIEEELRNFFSPNLIRECMAISKPNPNHHLTISDTFLGVDVARMGEDDSVLFLVRRIKNRLEEIEHKILPKQLLTKTVGDILNEDSKHNFKNIFIDDGGMGVGVFDPLLENPKTKRKVIAINNASRSVDSENRKKKLLKEDLYNNLLRLMEQKKILLIKDDETFRSLTSIQFEYTEKKNLRIFGNYSHITEALVRAAWCMKTKTLNPYVA